MTFAQQPRRVSILAGRVGHGGIGAILRDHCARWPANGIDTEVVVERGAEDAVSSACRLTRLATLHPLWGRFPLAVWLARTRPTAIVVHRPRLLRPLFAAMRLTGQRPYVVGAVHAMLSPQLPEAAARKRRAFDTLAHCDALVATSRAIADDLRRQPALVTMPLSVAWPPIDVARIATLAAEVPRAPRLGALDADYIVAVGRLEAVKGHARLVDAFARIAPIHPGLHLVVLGEGAERAALATRIRAAEMASRVHLAGHALNPFPWIRRARALVLASQHEGFGMVLAEALALGTPVIATDCPGGPAEILEHGRYGRLVAPGDESALADAIAAALAAPHRPARDAVARFDPDASSRVWLAALGVTAP
ncbi:MAG: glycosyltransferase [Azoarcus sp.]|nr:glycosyltransferase [Azoarcus sp.]